jgi:hypothetical protein
MGDEKKETKLEVGIKKMEIQMHMRSGKIRSSPPNPKDKDEYLRE